MGEMFNIRFKTAGGHVWWDTLALRGGYRLQQNKITGHARILDSDNVRWAWGSIGEMRRKFDSISSLSRAKSIAEKLPLDKLEKFSVKGMTKIFIWIAVGVGIAVGIGLAGIILFFSR